ncbi:MAG: cellulase family glycosylhydrolase, partial [bacterium]
MLQTADFANAQHEIKAHIEELIGQTNTAEFYDAWQANHVRKIDIDSLHAWGFNSVRLPMHYNLFTLPIEEEPVEGEHTWLEKGFIMTDSLINWCAQNQMYVVLDLHAAPGGQGKDEGISDYDPSKPSLWESKLNRDKTVALWMKLAERYADEPWVAGYVLINETNWEMPGNGPLKALYMEITDSIRTVDTNHIIFIEGNWFANDFTGLTPPWDDNMVYSPHKYWSFNDQASIQWVLDIREQYNTPLYFGEAGENSNAWFRDAIRLIEDNNIGWAWWPMKKIESIAGPLSVMKTAEYQVLLDYWSGNGEKPTMQFAFDALMETAELLKMENCIYQKDVIDAMFRQVYADEAIPFKTHEIPGTVHASDFDLGRPGTAYSDNDIANYQVSTGSYTAWNQGWSYRNDGVDIERSSDEGNSNGYNVGFVAPDEWMQYTVTVQENAAYDIKVRVASETTGGSFHFKANGADISAIKPVPATGGWQEWQTVTLPDVILTTDDERLRFIIDQKEFNTGSFEFVKKGSTTSIPAQYVSSFTLDEHTIHLNINKPIGGPLPAFPAGFQLFADQSEIEITDLTLDQNTRVILIKTGHTFKSSESITLSYNGTEIEAI